MYSRWGIRTFGPARTLAGNHGRMPRAGSPCGPVPQSVETVARRLRQASQVHPQTREKDTLGDAIPLEVTDPGVRLETGRSHRHEFTPRLIAPGEPVRERRVGFETQHPEKPMGLASPSRQIIPVALHGCCTSITRHPAYDIRTRTLLPRSGTSTGGCLQRSRLRGVRALLQVGTPLDAHGACASASGTDR